MCVLKYLVYKDIDIKGSLEDLLDVVMNYILYIQVSKSGKK